MYLMNLKIKDFNEINGTVKAPPSKSYSHRAVILASLANGTSKLYDVLYSEDVLASIRACEALGAVITKKKEIILKGGKSVKMDYLEVQGTDGRGQSIGSENLYSTMNSAETSGALTRADSQADIQTIVLIDALNAKVNEGESGNKSGIGIFKAGEKGLEFSLNDTAKKKLSPDKIGEIMAFLQAVKENTSVGTEAKEVAEAIETGIATEYGLEIERDDDAIEDTQTDFENQFDDGVNDSYEPDDDGSNDFANSLADYDED